VVSFYCEAPIARRIGCIQCPFGHLSGPGSISDGHNNLTGTGEHSVVGRS